MLLIAGLGNPGTKYAGNRHNIGFMALDRIASDHGFSPWRARFQGETAEGRLGRERVVLLKPSTFMNLSGQSVGEAMRYLKLEPAEVIILHDELDLPPGKVRLKTAGGHAGHNGLRSIHQHIGETYRRVRIGIGHPGHKDRVAAYVLADFAKAETEMVEDMLRGISDGAPDLADGADARFLNAIAGRTAPARNSGTVPDSAAKPAKSPKAAPETAGARPVETPPAPAPDAPPSGIADKLRALADRFK
ncbi:aminoacyl-tRNA hydrolase [Paracoccus aminophilus]|uniref:Peptidyl-tRNA hydrolase n=1 Tax=Paracoccus aminophilus JCM 7686 TaxID=1367847 RepID=S5XU24_PARAH|nr:aminoacyl-tRNA hydrolase [Paracoccus aminophilus]AGT08682.1 peptidyl-tRNA hydrolase [Paracoccus aminophilus JCM 7686]